MSFLSNIVDQVADTVGDNIGGAILDKVVDALKPPVRQEVSEHVNEFKTSAINEIPRAVKGKVEEGKDSDNMVEKVLSNVLDGKIEPMVQGILKFLTPGVDKVTADLPETITNTSTDYARELLNFDSDGENKPEAPEGEAHKPRGLTDILGEGAGALTSGGIQGKVESFLASLREKLHPVFDDLKPKIWELVPDTVQRALGELLGDDKEEGGQQEEQKSRGLLDNVGGFIQDQVEGQAKDNVPKLLGAVEGPVKDLISSMVDNLENACNKSFGDKLSDTLKQFKLV